MASNRERLDTLLVDLGLFQSRERAKRAIMAGIVFVDGLRIDKAGTKVEIGSEITVKEDPIPYVGRGGVKLEKALKHFGVNVRGKKALDIGASTGGFTDCLLQNGAERVYAIDVGYGQLDWKLRQDPRVVVMERTNIRYVKPEDIGETCDIAVIDVAFISLKLVLPVVKSLLHEDCEVIALIKPQFEAGRDKVGKKGIVKDPHVHLEVVESIAGFMQDLGLRVMGLTYSPITGSDGNIEYLIYGAGKGYENRPGQEPEIDINRVVEESHSVHG
ncbi:MAG: TlyA family RNA methyltransferase [Bacillota bacterium]|nr:TlyA family RNA methyltransferase [Bacillota bacterium]